MLVKNTILLTLKPNAAYAVYAALTIQARKAGTTAPAVCAVLTFITSFNIHAVITILRPRRAAALNIIIAKKYTSTIETILGARTTETEIAILHIRAAVYKIRSFGIYNTEGDMINAEQ